MAYTVILRLRIFFGEIAARIPRRTNTVVTIS
jgi:hypothetical protein